MENNSNKIIILLLMVIIVILGVLCILFATDTLTFNKKETNDNGEINTDVDNNKEKEIASKLVSIDNVKCNSSETTFNGVKVKLDLSKNEYDNCVINDFTINNKKVKEKGEWIDSYEIYDNNVIVMSYTTSSSLLSIYNEEGVSIMRLSTDTLDGYFVDSYKTNNNKIIIEGRECGLQCGNEESDYPTATFEIEYANNSFSNPKLVQKHAQ